MQRHGRSTAHGQPVQIVSSGPALQRKMLKDDVAGMQNGETTWQRARPVTPRLAVKTIELGARIILQFGFPRSSVVSQSDSHGIVGPEKFFDPLDQDLHIAKAAERGEELLRRPFHFFPLGIGVDVNQAVGQGTAAPNGHAQVVNRIGGEVDGRPVAFLEHPKHPRVESGLRLSDWLERSGRGGSGQEMAPAPIVAGWRLQRLGERWPSI